MNWFKKKYSCTCSICVPDPNYRPANITMAQLNEINKRLEIARNRFNLCEDWFECDGKHEIENVSYNNSGLVECNHCHSIIPYKELKYVCSNYEGRTYCPICNTDHIHTYKGKKK